MENVGRFRAAGVHPRISAHWLSLGPTRRLSKRPCPEYHNEKAVYPEETTLYQYEHSEISSTFAFSDSSGTGAAENCI
jgi:hypothetical protein